MDGSIVETPLLHHRREVPTRLSDCFEVGHGGFAATIHHANLGLVIAHLALTGVYLLPNREIAAIHGADAARLEPESVALR